MSGKITEFAMAIATGQFVNINSPSSPFTQGSKYEDFVDETKCGQATSCTLSELERGKFALAKWSISKIQDFQ